MCGKDAGRGEGPNGTPSGGCPVGLPVEGSGGVSEKSFETRGCLIRCAVDAGSDGTRIGFEGTHVIVDLDENIAEVVQVRHQHVRIHRPTNPARPRSVWSDSNRNSEKGAVTARAPSVFLSAKGRRGVDTANDARGTFTHVRAARPSTLFPSPVHRDANRTREGVGGIHRRVRSSTRAPPSRDTLLAARVWTTDRYVRYARLDEQPGWNRVAR